jgi:predicted nucleotidyltransferase
MVLAGLDIDKARLRELCRRHGIQRLALFGSRLRGDAGPESDVDLLVEFQPGESVGLRLFRIQDELTGLFGHPVDLLTPGFLSPHFRSRVEKESVPIYEAA